MPHSVYQTPAFVLSTTSMRESNKLAVLYTRDFGVIYVAAQSIRELSSKMKSHLHKLSLVDVDVVRGRDIWRLTGIHEVTSSLSFADTKWYPLIDRFGSSLKRLCPGEEAHPEIWEDIQSLFAFLESDNEFSKEDISFLEVILMSRTLNHLGYWSGDELVITSQELYNHEVREYMNTHKKDLIKKINERLHQTQL
jgi:recombinational DNA repair protein (RecF pathway)